MNFTKVREAVAVLDEVKTLDASIQELEVFANLVVNSQTKITMSLGATDLEAPAKEEKLINWEEQQTPLQAIWEKMYSPKPFMHFETGYAEAPAKEEKPTLQLKLNLSDVSLLRVLEVVLEQKRVERNKLGDKLKAMGVLPN